MTKTCRKCKEEKDLIEGFCVRKKSKDGRGSLCKSCNAAEARKWGQDNPEKSRAKGQRWYKANQEWANRRNREWRQKNREQYLFTSGSYYRLHREEIIRRAADWVRANPEKKKASLVKRKALKRGYDGEHFTGEDVLDLFVIQSGECAYCKIPLDKATYHVDHVVPLSRGGGNGADNICLACPECNMSKSNKLLGHEWCACDKYATVLKNRVSNNNVLDL